MNRLVSLGLVAAVVVPAVWLGGTLGETDWTVQRPQSAVRTGTLDDAAREASALAASRRHPGLFWTVLDSGNEPVLILLDSAGTVRGRVLLRAANHDWEAVALGACPAGVCVYVGDIGDNRARRARVVIHRLPEPGPDALQAGRAEDLESLAVEYPTGPRDAEAIGVTPAGDLLIVTKGLASPIEAFRVPAGAWGRSGSVVADAMGVLPISPRTAIGRWVTDAALAPDGRRTAIRTYRDIFFFVLEPDGRLVPAEPPTLCDVSGLESQGEGITWANDSTFVLASEGGVRTPGTIHFVRCRWP